MSSEGDVAGQLSMLSRCADYCQRVGAGHTHLLATLARGAVLLTHHDYSVRTHYWGKSCLYMYPLLQEAGSVLNVASSVLENHRGPGQVLLRTFYLTIQVTHLLMAGQVSSPHSILWRNELLCIQLVVVSIGIVCCNQHKMYCLLLLACNVVVERCTAA